MLRSRRTRISVHHLGRLLLGLPGGLIAEHLSKFDAVASESSRMAARRKPQGLQPGSDLPRKFQQFKETTSSLIAAVERIQLQLETAQAGTGRISNHAQKRPSQHWPRVCLRAAADAKADAEGIASYERAMASLKIRQEALQRRLKSNKRWVEWFDAEVEPQLQRFDNLKADLSGLYADAKQRHAKGIQLLRREFGYHPEFKRPGDVITGVSFTPK